MEFFETLRCRKSCRCFTGEVVPDDVLNNILECAARAPSSKNVQPWGIFVIRGKALDNFKADYYKAYAAEEKGRNNFKTYPEPLPNDWMARARETGYGIFAHKGIDRRDLEKRKEHMLQNAHFFYAPHVMYLTTKTVSEKGTFLDLGMFMVNVLNGLVASGFAGCPMFSAVMYPDIVARHLKLPVGIIPVCGIPFGREADEHVNKYTTNRRPLEDWVSKIE